MEPATSPQSAVVPSASVVVLEPVPTGVACASDSLTPAPAASSSSDNAAPGLLEVLSTPVHQTPAPETLGPLIAIMDDLVTHAPYKQSSEAWQIFCTFCAPLAWHVKENNQPIQEMFQHLVNDAIALGLGQLDNLAVDRATLLMRKSASTGTR